MADWVLNDARRLCAVLCHSELVTERHRIPTPEGATPQGVCDTVGELAKHFDWSGPIGVGFPAAIKPDGTVLTAANIR